MSRLPIFLVAAPGLEETVAAEARLQAGSAAAVPGGVELDGDLETLYRLCLWSRVASRVLLRLGEVRARDFARLRRDAAALRWDTVLGDGAPPSFAVTTHHCRLHHTGAIAERLVGAIEDRLGRTIHGPTEYDPHPDVHAGGGASSRRSDEGAYSLSVTEERRSDAPQIGGQTTEAHELSGLRPRNAAAEPARFVVRGEDDRFVISADASGELLHRRGYRQDAAPAPLRETLAAGVLLLAGFTPGTPLVDPACGSGTFVIEAGLIAAGRAPGARRGFAFQSWPGYKPELWSRLVAAAERGETPVAAPLLGADIDAAAVAAARRNAERAGVTGATFVQTEAARLVLPDGPAGLVVANPPYGRRLEATRGVYRAIGALARKRGWALALLTSDRDLASLCGQPERVIGLVSGGLRVGLYLFSRRSG